MRYCFQNRLKICTYILSIYKKCVFDQKMVFSEIIITHQIITVLSEDCIVLLITLYFEF